MKYVVGFLHDGENVVLVKKNRPKYLKGKLNGPGGKMEGAESIFEAMEREFFEEAGIRIKNWNAFASILFNDYADQIFFLEKKVPTSVLYRAKTMESEPVKVWKVSKALNKPFASNLGWALHMAISPHKFNFVEMVQYQ